MNELKQKKVSTSTNLKLSTQHTQAKYAARPYPQSTYDINSQQVAFSLKTHSKSHPVYHLEFA